MSSLSAFNIKVIPHTCLAHCCSYLVASSGMRCLENYLHAEDCLVHEPEVLWLLAWQLNNAVVPTIAPLYLSVQPPGGVLHINHLKC